MKGKTAAFTGHRIIAQADLPTLSQRLDETITELITQGVVFFGAGGARGFDALASKTVLKARESNPAVKLIMVLPCSNQEVKWSENEKQEYRQLLDAADKVVYVSEQPYFDGCMKARNSRLVEESSVCVAYMKHGRSGTGQTVRLAREHGLRVINLAE